MHSTSSLVKTYHQLIQAQRYQIYALRKTKHSLAEIAKVPCGTTTTGVPRQVDAENACACTRPSAARDQRRKAKPKTFPVVSWLSPLNSFRDCEDAMFYLNY
jgi:hypothetical protein